MYIKCILFIKFKVFRILDANNKAKLQMKKNDERRAL